MRTSPHVFLAHAFLLQLRTYKDMGMGQLHLLRQTLQRFFQDKRVKVSLFLQVWPPQYGSYSGFSALKHPIIIHPAPTIIACNRHCAQSPCYW